MRLVWATVTAIETDAAGIRTLAVRLDTGETGSAITYTALAPECAEGDRVLLNTTAVDLALGTGGRHFVVARGGEGGVALERPSGGHIMKLRYTPLQLDVMSVESPESPHHAVMKEARALGGLPVVCCGLHSQVPLVAAAVKHTAPSLKVAYCMTDGAALSASLSNIIAASKDAGLIDDVITCGQAFGGDLEAVNLHSGLLAARHVSEADVAIVAIGPGVVGTGTPLGHGGVAQGESINAVHALDGTPVACLRLSFADMRPRHQGVSHHTLAALGDIALAPAIVAVPRLHAEQQQAIESQLEARAIWTRHQRADAAAAVPPLRGVRVTTMGRGPEEDPAFFAAAFAAGDVAARRASAPG